jgi:hypothetical protein
MSRQGPGIWLHWHCADRVTNLVELPSCGPTTAPTARCFQQHSTGHWQDKWWIPLPKDYEAKYQGTCGFCGDPIIGGDRVAKVMTDARTLWG